MKKLQRIDVVAELTPFSAAMVLGGAGAATAVLGPGLPLAVVMCTLAAAGWGVEGYTLYNKWFKRPKPPSEDVSSHEIALGTVEPTVEQAPPTIFKEIPRSPDREYERDREGVVDVCILDGRPVVKIETRVCIVIAEVDREEALDLAADLVMAAELLPPDNKPRKRPEPKVI